MPSLVNLQFDLVHYRLIVAHHNLSHFPYRSWCLFCVAGCKPNSHHSSRDVDTTRNLPAFHADYCFVRDKDDPATVTVCVGTMSPSKSMLVALCDTKGPEDAYCLNRVENFLKDEGVSKISYRSDQESSIVSLIEVALAKLWQGWFSYQRIT